MIDFDEIVEAAREAMDAGETTKTGLPKVEAMEAILGYEITAEDRDAAYEALQGGQPEPVKAETEAEALVYVGPNLTGSNHVLQFTVFRGGLPESLRARVEKDTRLARLFVPIPDLTKMRKALAQIGSAAERAFRDVLKKQRERSV